MLCLQCVHWTVESFTYATLKEKWDRLLSTPITPGYRQKFEKRKPEACHRFRRDGTAVQILRQRMYRQVLCRAQPQ